MQQSGMHGVGMAAQMCVITAKRDAGAREWLPGRTSDSRNGGRLPAESFGEHIPCRPPSKIVTISRRKNKNFQKKGLLNYFKNVNIKSKHSDV